MSFIDVKIAVVFIRVNALQGPKQIDANGSYAEGIITAAVQVSANDTALCPNM